MGKRQSKLQKLNFFNLAASGSEAHIGKSIFTEPTSFALFHYCFARAMFYGFDLLF
jgi:hypothetical protein